jgi:hypothetical protein
VAEIYLTLLRTGKDLKGEERGILKVMEGNFMTKVFSTRENDATLKYSSLRMGVYEMKHSKKEFNLDGTPAREVINCLRPTDQRIGRILIHRALNNNPNNLQGCIAPGVWGNVNEFNGSEEAMAQLFEALGGYEEGKLVTLHVLSNASGVGFDTKETWWRTK